jgi:hypothetical protein
MDQAFFEGLGLEASAVEAILAAHGAALAQQQLQHQVTMAIGQAGGRNHTAIRALLDLDALAAAEDTAQAVTEAVATLKAENGYLFEAPTPPPYAKQTGAATAATGSEPTTLAAALRQRMKR